MRPSFVRSIRPARSKTRRCLEIAGSETAWGDASSVTVATPRCKRARIVRRIGSAIAAKVRSSRLPECLTIWLSIERRQEIVKLVFLICRQTTYVIGVSQTHHRVVTSTEAGSVHLLVRLRIADRNDCRNLESSSHGSACSERSRADTFSIVKWSALTFTESSSQARGVETGAPGRARVEYAATAVAPRALRR